MAFRFEPFLIGRNRWNNAENNPPWIFDQKFGNCFSEGELHPQTSYRGYYVSPRTQASINSSGTSQVRNKEDMFEVRLDVSDFEPEDIEVKVVGDFIVIHGKHEEKEDDNGFITRNFRRRYMLPVGTEAETVISSLSASGMLTIQAPKKPIETVPRIERVIPITLTNSRGG